MVIGFGERMKFVLPAIFVASLSLFSACSDDSSLLDYANSEEELLLSSGWDVYSSSEKETEQSSSSIFNPFEMTSSAFSSSSQELTCQPIWTGNSAVTITEVMTRNVKWLDDLGKDPGWIELYNSSDKAVALDGYSLVEKTERPRKWVIVSDTIPAKSYRIIFASKRDITTPLVGIDSDEMHYRLHTNWKLEDNGGSVYLIQPNCEIADSATYPLLEGGVSWGKTADGWKYFAVPTPEMDNANSTGSSGFTAIPALEQSAGFYAEPVTITPPKMTDGSTVRCTFNGSIPTEETEEMTEAKEISQTTVVRCAAFKDGMITNKISTNTYFIGEEIHNMPVVSISVDSQFFKKHYLYTKAGSTTGDSPESVDPNNTGLYADVEFPIHVEYFANGSASTGKDWEYEAGISMMGGHSRLEKKKSVAIKFGEEYQSGWLKYPLFETRKDKNSKFKGFNLRNNGNRFVSDYLEDAMGGAILEGSGVDYQRSHQVIVFYDGVYWGIHDMRERYNKNYVETNYDIDAGDVTMVKHINRKIEVNNGNLEYQVLLQYVADNDFSGENNLAYETVKAAMDVDNFAAYMAAEMYMHNGDWPNNNVRAWKSPYTKWKFMVYDLDHGMDWEWSVNGFWQSTNMFDWVKQGGYSSGKCYRNNSGDCFHTFYVKLIKNPDFRRMFINRAAVLLQENVNSENITNTLETMAGTLDADQISRDQDLFKQEFRYYRNSCGNGFSVSGSCMKTWALERDGVFRSELREEFGLSGDISVSISSLGEGYVTLDGFMLPHKNYEGIFFEGNAMLLTAVPSGTGKFVSWEDGSTENPRLVMPTKGSAYVATFQ